MVTKSDVYRKGGRTKNRAPFPLYVKIGNQIIFQNCIFGMDFGTNDHYKSGSMKSIFILLFVLMSTSGCKNELNQISIDKNFELNYKEIRYFPDHSASITLDSVLNDSRCPNGAECVWAGNAEVRFIYSAGTQNSAFILNTLSNFRTDTLINGYRIKLVRLNPYPQMGLPIKQNEYSAEVKITKE
jgi:hypothetical protein